MKNLFIVALALTFLFIYAGTASAEDFSMWKIGYGIPGLGQLQFTSSNSSGESFSSAIENAYSLGYEFLSELDETLELGVGVQYQAATFGSNRFTNMPIYLLLNYYPLTTDKIPYFTGRLGYHISFNCNNDTYSNSKPAYENVYCAVGGGIKLRRSYPSIRLEALYTLSLGYAHYKDNYDQINSPYLPLSYNFDAQIFSNSLALYLGFEF